MKSTETTTYVKVTDATEAELLAAFAEHRKKGLDVGVHSHGQTALDAVEAAGVKVAPSITFGVTGKDTDPATRALAKAGAKFYGMLFSPAATERGITVQAAELRDAALEKAMDAAEKGDKKAFALARKLAKITTPKTKDSAQGVLAALKELGVVAAE